MRDGRFPTLLTMAAPFSLTTRLMSHGRDITRKILTITSRGRKIAGRGWEVADRSLHTHLVHARVDRTNRSGRLNKFVLVTCLINFPVN